MTVGAVMQVVFYIGLSVLFAAFAIVQLSNRTHR